MRNPSCNVDLSAIPSFCGHEHWGSIASIGYHPQGFRADAEWGALPTRPSGLVDLLLDPYLGGLVYEAGHDPHGPAIAAGYPDCYALGLADPRAAHGILGPILSALAVSGAVQCLRRGILELYGADILTADADAWTRLDAQVRSNYDRLFEWYEAAMRTAHLTRPCRPVWPQMYYSSLDSPEAVHERAITHTLLRVDAFLEMWRADYPSRGELVAIAGIDPVDAASWRAYLDVVFDRAEGQGCIATKQAQAYSRSLHYEAVDDAQVKWSGDRTPEDVRRWQDWVMHECFRRTEARGWPHQCHVGTHNLPLSAPAPLGAVAERYPGMKLVLLHCWPYLDDAGWLARRHANVYLDCCWQVVLNPEFFRRALAGWLGYVPLHKITVSHDATSVEMAAGACSLVREILGETLAGKASVLGLSSTSMTAVAGKILHDNAVALYGGTEGAGTG